MCFSATASFATVAITGVAGLVALGRCSTSRELPLAATPLMFAAQQAIEGLLWLELAEVPAGPTAGSLTLLFLLFAKVFWPTYVPMTAYLLEPDPQRRRVLVAFVAIGVAVSAYFAWSVTSHRLTASIGHDHIIYGGEPRAPIGLQAAYFVVTGLTATLSSFQTLRIFAAIVLVGSLVSFAFYWEAFSSVWCFFAAAASAVIVFHFEQLRQARRAQAA